LLTLRSDLGSVRLIDDIGPTSAVFIQMEE